MNEVLQHHTNQVEICPKRSESSAPCRQAETIAANGTAQHHCHQLYNALQTHALHGNCKNHHKLKNLRIH